MKARLVPWTIIDEWQTVKSLLYPPAFDPTSISRGASFIRSWASRGQVPHAAEVTAMLAECTCLEYTSNNIMPESALRLTYSMAIIRFVNGLVDASQVTGRLQSVAAVADSLGIPLWIVDLRHAATHESLPSLSLLRAAAQQALRWLDAHYWSLQTTRTETFEDQVPDLLDQYLNVMVELTENGVSKDTLLAQTRDNLIQTLCEGTHSESFRDTLNVEWARLLVSEGSDEITRTDELIWTPLLEGVYNAMPECLEELCLVLYHDLDDPSRSSSTMTVGWTKHLLKAYILRDTRDGKDVIEACLQHPNTFTPTLLQSIIALRPSLKPSLQPFMTYLSTQPSTSDVNCVDDVEELIGEVDEVAELRMRANKLVGSNILQANGESNSIPSSEIWKLAPSKPWKGVPIGLLPGGKPCSLSLSDADWELSAILPQIAPQEEDDDVVMATPNNVQTSVDKQQADDICDIILL
ncbi:hypothetical protein SmJEL517_g03987 [Synchytrium microbalum]|uniref:Uncharacterized protein n=1 Tax=Synchytrium microbalum TaxID=1806994 RepID=A0A507C0R2_9FUNG|nr:uncharacterized protein SmJEL517_g03987 [Synchytrium microbalum]TPX33001.1 hypothetical protein SmJEL517_g03987 [Synchytrium microbalum]